jgi:hypothetical protein
MQYYTPLSGALAKELRKTTNSIVLPLCLALRLPGTTRLPLGGFSLNSVFGIFTKKFIDTFQFWLKL